MSDFVQTMKDWRRMCKAYSTDDDDCCNDCPVVDFREHGCGAIFEMEDSTDWERYEGAVRQWTAEHPEPVYPTWYEWLEKMGIMTDIHDKLNNHMQVMEVCGMPLYSIPTEKVFCHIPADIAQKLGIEPKE